MVPVFLRKVKGDPRTKSEEGAGKSEEDQTWLFRAKGKRAAWGYGGGPVGVLSTQMRFLRPLPAANSMKLCHSPKTTILWGQPLGWPRASRGQGEKELEMRAQ